MVHKAFGSTGWREVMSSTTFKKSLCPGPSSEAAHALQNSSMTFGSQLKKMIGHGEDVVVPALTLSPGAGEDRGARWCSHGHDPPDRELQPPRRLRSLLNVAADLICA